MTLCRCKDFLRHHQRQIRRVAGSQEEVCLLFKSGRAAAPGGERGRDGESGAGDWDANFANEEKKNEQKKDGKKRKKKLWLVLAAVPRSAECI